MKQSEIKARHIYRNRGAGNVLRFVLGVGDYTPPSYYSMKPRPDEPGVWYRDSKGAEGVLYMRSFAHWAGACVCDASGEDFILKGEVDFKLLEAFKDL